MLLNSTTRPLARELLTKLTSYVDGMMDGEAIERVRKGKYSMGVIWLA